MKKEKTKKATIVVWDGELLVDYKDFNKKESSFLIKTAKDINDLIEELTKAGYTKKE